MFRSAFTRVALAAIAVMSIGDATARADLQIQISINGGAFQNFAAAPGGTTVNPATFTMNGITFTLSGSSNQPLGVSFAQISQANLLINGGAAGVTLNSLVIQVSSNGFMSPGGPSIMGSSVSGSYGLGVSAVGNQTFQSVLNLSNTLFATAGTNLTGGPQNFLLPPVTTTTAISESLDTPVNVTSVPFSLTNTFTFTSLSIGAGSQLQITGTTTVTPTPIPEPATIIGAGIALASIGAFRFRKRRQPKA